MAGKPQKMKLKTCVFPGCDVEFIGRGKAKYCEEHRKAKYRKELYKKNDNTGGGIIVIEHDEVYAKPIIRKCNLVGCPNDYEIVLIPRLYEYSNYCEDHRNEFKREMFLKRNNSDTENL
jgi:hypothetical protein